MGERRFCQTTQRSFLFVASSFLNLVYSTSSQTSLIFAVVTVFSGHLRAFDLKRPSKSCCRSQISFPYSVLIRSLRSAPGIFAGLIAVSVDASSLTEHCSLAQPVQMLFDCGIDCFSC